MIPTGVSVNRLGYLLTDGDIIPDFQRSPNVQTVERLELLGALQPRTSGEKSTPPPHVDEKRFIFIHKRE